MSAPPDVSAPPDWSAHGRDVLCPLCDYNLRGLTEPRCPECGYRFRWAELFDERLSVHPYLFEHHPERNAWSFRRTLFGGLRPARFWKVLHPGQGVRPRRLLVYWLTAAVVTGLLGAAVPLAAGAVLSNAAYPSQWGRWYSSYYQPGRPSYHWPDGSSRAEPPPAVPHYFHELGWNTSWQEFGQDYVTAFAAACAWPWVTLLTLMIFRASMRRAKVRPGHVRRCVLYSADVFLWAGLYVFALTALAMMSWMSSGATRMHHHLAIVSLPIGWGLATHRLGRAYSQYLRFDRPWATVIASQVIVALLALLLLLHFALDRMIHEWRIL